MRPPSPSERGAPLEANSRAGSTGAVDGGRGGRSSRGQLVDGAAVLLVLAGCAARLNHLASNRSLWLDESMLGMNILYLPWRRLVGPLDYRQAAPVGFLLLERLVVTLLGPSEWTLRLVPFLAGCAALPLTWALAKRLVRPGPALVALGIVAMSIPAIYFAAEVKQYSGDLLACVGLLLLAARYREEPDDHGRFRALLAAGMLAPWFSHPATFVLAATGLVLALEAVKRRRIESVFPLALLAAGWSASFGILWVISLSRDPARDSLIGYWAGLGCFPPTSLWAQPGWILSTASRIARDTVGLPIPALAVVLAAAGLSSLLAGPRRVWGALFVLLFSIAFGASALRLMPLCDRLALYLVPVVALLLAAAVDQVSASTWYADRRSRRVFQAAAIAVLAVTAIRYPWRRVVEPPARDHLRPVLEALARRTAPGDVVLVHYRAWAATSLYSRLLDLPDLHARRFGNWPASDKAPRSRRGPVGLVAELPANGRTWFVSVQASRREGEDNRAILDAFRRRGRQLDSIESSGAGAWLFDLLPPAGPGSPRAPASRANTGE